MQIRSFHHPDLSLPVIRRRVSEELIELLAGMGSVLLTRGWALIGGEEVRGARAYRGAVRRLQKKGFVAYRQEGGAEPVLALTDEGKAQVPEVCRRKDLWPKKWSGIWHVLAYDVPEDQRLYRDVLRVFLKRMRMGCLQRSVWITPRDIRPEYDDLCKAAAVDSYSFLFELRTVLGRSAGDLVHTAWDVLELERVQSWYCEVYADNLERVLSGKVAGQLLATLAREELAAYLAVMEKDPLLPRDLWPDRYRGEEVVKVHQHMNREISKRVCRGWE